MTNTPPGIILNNHRATKKGIATYEKVIQAGIELIANEGFHAASTNKIARVAGVTWGTLQHQFGDKANLLEAILTFCFKEQMQQLQSISTLLPLQERIDALVEAIWRMQQCNSSQAIHEILLGVRGDSELNARFNPTLQKLRNLYNQQWQVFFADIDYPIEHMEAVKQLAFATLRGLAFEVTVRSSDDSIQIAKALLKTTIFNCFTAKSQIPVCDTHPENAPSSV